MVHCMRMPDPKIKFDVRYHPPPSSAWREKLARAGFTPEDEVAPALAQTLPPPAPYTLDEALTVWEIWSQGSK